jgi:hypothetical protein
LERCIKQTRYDMKRPYRSTHTLAIQSLQWINKFSRYPFNTTRACLQVDPNMEDSFVSQGVIDEHHRESRQPTSDENVQNSTSNHTEHAQIPHETKATNPMDPPSKSPQLSKLDKLHETYLQVAQERRSLLLQLQSNLSGGTPSSSKLMNTADPYLPSIHAHSRPITPLTPVVEEELLRKAHAIGKTHIKQLHRYNEIRDAGLGLIGMVAESRKLRIKDVMEEFGVTNAD